MTHAGNCLEGRWAHAIAVQEDAIAEAMFRLAGHRAAGRDIRAWEVSQWLVHARRILAEDMEAWAGVPEYMCRCAG